MRILWILALVAGCEHGKGGASVGGSGVDESKQVGDLDGGEIDQLCRYLISIAPEPRTVECSGGEPVEIEATTQADCSMALSGPDSAFDTCDITVGEYELCVEAIFDRDDAEICAMDLPPACQPLLDCVSGMPTDPPPPEPQPGS